MVTSITSIARLARQGRALSIPLLVAGALAAGCGTAHAPASSGAGGASTASAPTATASAPAATPTPVPTITGGAVGAGHPACVGWPTNAAHGVLPLSFTTVAVERCVIGVQNVPGKGQWETATLEKATKDLTPLINVLRRPPALHTPGTFCPNLAMLPPQVLLISSTGQQLIPRLPVSGCGLVQSAVLSALAALPWHPVSVHLVAPVQGSSSGVSVHTITPAPISPNTVQTLPDTSASHPVTTG